MFAELYAKAHAAGHAAAMGHTPAPMVVGEVIDLFGDEIDYDKPTYYVSEGVCGFAWINVRPGTSKFARWLKMMNYARAAYRGGVDIWVKDYGQSYERKMKYASAFSRVLEDEGIHAYSDGRLD